MGVNFFCNMSAGAHVPSKKLRNGLFTATKKRPPFIRAIIQSFSVVCGCFSGSQLNALNDSSCWENSRGLPEANSTPYLESRRTVFLTDLFLLLTPEKKRDLQTSDGSENSKMIAGSQLPAIFVSSPATPPLILPIGRIHELEDTLQYLY